MVKNVPALGWNSWNTFGGKINESVVLESADAMVSTGLKDAGYEYVVIDDCWALRERSSDGHLVPDPEKFPHGMKYVADYVHSKGLKFGMYSCAGTMTCAGYPASFQHEYVDAADFAAWGVDFLKYDYCFHPTTIPGHIMYKRMSLALLNCGRDILFSACSWGSEDTKTWIKETGANMWRSTGDINDSWKSIRELAQKELRALEYNGMGCFNDMDMLVCGMNGSGNVAVTGCTQAEYETHFALWAMLGSPLMIGCDIRNMSAETKVLLTNPGLLRINQDKAYRQTFFARKLEKHAEPRPVGTDFYDFSDPFLLDHPLLAKILDDGSIALGYFNLSDEDSSIWHATLGLDALGLPADTGRTLELENVFTGEKTLVKNSCHTFSAPAHGCVVYIARVVEA